MIAATELGSPAQDEALEELKEYQRGDFEGIFRSNYLFRLTIICPYIHTCMPHAHAVRTPAASSTPQFSPYTLIRVMDGLPVTIRLLDPPLHEFLPHEGPALTRLCSQVSVDLIKCGDKGSVA